MKIFELKKIKKPYFGYEDISQVLGISAASAKVTASRYVKQGILLRMKKNMYVLRDTWDTAGREDKFMLANMAQVPSYISLMTALDYYEITTQVQRNFFESVAVKRSREINVNGSVFRYVKLAADLTVRLDEKRAFLLPPPRKHFWTHFTCCLMDATVSILPPWIKTSLILLKSNVSAANFH
jgi:predicted transcriptional regulator of viral defense system